MFVRSVGPAGEDLDPRDVVPAPTSALWRSRGRDFRSVLDAPVEALTEVDQLRLAAELTSCVAVLDWKRCKIASSLAIKDLDSPLTQRASEQCGGVQLIRLGGPETPRVSEGIVTELALVLGCSEQAARDFIAVGLDLRFRLRCTNNDFGGGRITYGHAKVISEATRTLPVEVAERLDARLADAAQTRPPARLRVLARGLVARADPAAAARRHAAGYAERSLSTFPIGDGIAAVSMNHDLTVASVIDDQLHTWALRRRRLDPTTSFSAHKADAAALLLLGRHPLTGRPLLPEGEGGPPMADGLTLSAEVTEQLTSGAADPRWLLPIRTEVRVTMPADTLLGIDDETCELDGHGPLTAGQARRLVLSAAPAVLRRVFTDPVDGSIMTLDAHRYPFRADQTEAIAALHPVSAFPGSTVPARRCDNDHRIAYKTGPPGCPDPPGQTVVANGQPLDRRRHRIRTHLDWRAAVDPDDAHTITWTSPHGLVFVVHDHDGA